MRVLIISCSTGGGHNAAGYAMKEQLESAGHSVTMINYMDLAGKKVSGRVDNSYVNLVKNSPQTFGAIYKVGALISSSKRRSPVYYANAVLAKYLKAYLMEHPVDFILTTHLYGAETLTYMKRHMEMPPTLAITTDYTCIPFWEETDCDAYILPHRAMLPEYVGRGMKREKLLPYGIPVSMKFRREYRQEEVRRELGLPENDRILLLMGGSMGFGKLEPLARMVYAGMDEGETLAVICGSNAEMRKELQKQFDGLPHIQIMGQTDRVASYMAVSDLVYTKPGGLTSTEAAAARCPIVHTDPIPGCETKNRKFFMRQGMSVSADTPEGQVRMGRQLMASSTMREKMREAQAQNIDPYASLRIMEWMEGVLE